MFVISGTTGRTGRVVAETLRARGVRVRALDARLDDRSALTRALTGATGFYVLLPEDPGAADVHGPRRRMADAMAAAVRASGVPHVVFLSAIAASLADGNGPASDLHHAERALADSGARVSTLRSAFFQENVLAALAPARQGGIYPSLVPADVVVPTTATRDVGAVAARCLLDPPARSEVIDLVGPLYSTRDMAAALSTALGLPLTVVEIPPAAHVEAFTAAGLSPAFAAAVAELHACLATGRVQASTIDGARIILSRASV